MVALPFLFVAFVVTVNEPLTAPAAIVMLAGTVASAVLELDSVSVAPPAGAGAVNVAVPVAEVPPTTLVGFKASVASVGGGTGVTVSALVRVTPA